MRPTPASRAGASSSSDLLLPWSTRRSAGTPAARATWQLAARRARRGTCPPRGPAGPWPGTRTPWWRRPRRRPRPPPPPGRRDAGGPRRRRTAACRTPRPGRAGRRRRPRGARRIRSSQSGAAGCAAATRRAWPHVVGRRHGSAGYGSVPPAPGRGPAPRRVRSSPALAPVAQRIEHRPPEPVAQVRVLPGAPHTRGRRVPGTRCEGARESTGQSTGPGVPRAGAPGNGQLPVSPVRAGHAQPGD